MLEPERLEKLAFDPIEVTGEYALQNHEAGSLTRKDFIRKILHPKIHVSGNAWIGKCLHPEMPVSRLQLPGNTYMPKCIPDIVIPDILFPDIYFPDKDLVSNIRKIKLVCYCFFHVPVKHFSKLISHMLMN